MSYEIGRVKWKGVTPNKNGYGICDSCGGTRIHIIEYFSEAEVYGYVYKCFHCGAHITQTIKRESEDVRQ